MQLIGHDEQITIEETKKKQEDKKYNFGWTFLDEKNRDRDEENEPDWIWIIWL